MFYYNFRTKDKENDIRIRRKWKWKDGAVFRQTLCILMQIGSSGRNVYLKVFQQYNSVLSFCP